MVPRLDIRLILLNLMVHYLFFSPRAGHFSLPCAIFIQSSYPILSNIHFNIIPILFWIMNGLFPSGLCIEILGRDSSVGIADSLQAGRSGDLTPWGRDFPHPSRPTVVPTQRPLQWVPGLSRG